MPRLVTSTDASRSERYIRDHAGEWLNVRVIAGRCDATTKVVRDVFRKLERFGTVSTYGERAGKRYMFTPTPTREQRLEAALKLAQHKVSQVLAGQGAAEARLQAALVTMTEVLENWDENTVGAGYAGRLTPKELLNGAYGAPRPDAGGDSDPAGPAAE